jgi:archaellin
MRLFNFIAWFVIVAAMAYIITPAQAEAVTQKVCHTDDKTKREVCRVIKTHKKVEGTAVPERAPAPSKSKFAKQQ